MGYDTRRFRWHFLLDSKAREGALRQSYAVTQATAPVVTVAEATPPTYNGPAAAEGPCINTAAGTYTVTAGAAGTYTATPTLSETNLIGDNVDLDALVIQANCEIEIQSMNAYVSTADADAEVELCSEDNTVLCKIVLASTGHVAAAGTFPIRLAPQSATLPKLLKLRTNNAVDSDTKAFIDVVITGLK
jgi:hypothetical protein